MQLTDLPLYNQLLLLLDLANIHYYYRANYYLDPHGSKSNKISSNNILIPLTNDPEKLKEYEIGRYPHNEDYIVVRREYWCNGITFNINTKSLPHAQANDPSTVIERFGLLQNALFKEKSITPVIEKCYAMVSALNTVTSVDPEIILIFQKLLDATIQLQSLDEILYQKFYFDEKLSSTIETLFNSRTIVNDNYSTKFGQSHITFYSRNSKQRIKIAKDLQLANSLQFSILDISDPSKYIQINYPSFQPDTNEHAEVYQQVIDKMETDVKPYSQDEHFQALYENVKQYLTNIKLNVDLEPAELF